MKICYQLLFGEPYVESRGTKMSWIPHHTGDISTTKKTIDNKFFICGKHLWLFGGLGGGGGGGGLNNQTGPILVHIYPLFYINLHVKYRSNIITRYKCCAQHNGRVANYCHVPLVIRRVHITSTPQAIHLLALCGEVINIHLRTKKDRSRSSIFELEIHPWYKFGINATNIDWVTCLSCL